MGCGRLFEGTPVQMFDSLAKLKQLPGDTKVYCAHEYTAANVRAESPHRTQRARNDCAWVSFLDTLKGANPDV